MSLHAWLPSTNLTIRLKPKIGTAEAIKRPVLCLIELTSSLTSLKRAPRLRLEFNAKNCSFQQLSWSAAKSKGTTGFHGQYWSQKTSMKSLPVLVFPVLWHGRSTNMRCHLFTHPWEANGFHPQIWWLIIPPRSVDCWTGCVDMVAPPKKKQGENEPICFKVYI